MGQAGAQREPSMEEILASIRRIIENNEPAQDLHAAAETEAASSDEAGENDYFSTDTGHGDDELPEAAAPSASSSEPVSLAEVVARTRQGPAAAEAPLTVEVAGDETEAAEADLDEDYELDEAAAEDLRAALRAEEPVMPSQPAEVVEQPTTDQPAISAAAVSSNEQAPAAKSPEIAAQSEPAPRAEPEPAQRMADDAAPRESTGQLVSLHTGEKVAAAFGELDAAIAAGQRRSFDEIAEEMLRPMLTQWLDDNLPTLVERLVREEIERVSRGNRR